MEPGPLDELLPGWRDHAPAICVPAARDEFLFMTRRKRYRLPITPPQMANHGNFIISLGQLVPILGAEAEKLGVDVFAGICGREALFDPAGAVKGVRIGDMGVEKNGEPGPNFALGPEIHAKITMFCEGCRGSTSKQLIARFKLDAGKSPQTYGLGFKEMWQLPPGRVQPGLIQHTLGWPLDNRTYGGSFLYHLDNDRVYVGFVVGLDYEDPRFKPFEAFQQYKNHPEIKSLLQGGEIIAGGARTVIEGGYQSMPTLEMPGRDVGRRCRRHAQHAQDQGHPSGDPLRHDRRRALRRDGHERRLRQALARIAGGRELHKVRNIRPGFRRGLWLGLANAALETLTFGKSALDARQSRRRQGAEALDDYASPDRHWGERELPPRDRLASYSSPPPRTMRINRCICTSPTPRCARPAASRNSATPARISVRRTSTK
jgi:electron-transferring-flavoprotein dehydrogenase